MISQSLLDTLCNATNRDLYLAIYTIISILLTMPVSSKERSFNATRRVNSYLRSTIGDEQLSNLSLMHIHTTMYINMCKYTFPKLIQVKNNE